MESRVTVLRNNYFRFSTSKSSKPIALLFLSFALIFVGASLLALVEQEPLSAYVWRVCDVYLHRPHHSPSFKYRDLCFS